MSEFWVYDPADWDKSMWVLARPADLVEEMEQLMAPDHDPRYEDEEEWLPEWSKYSIAPPGEIEISGGCVTIADNTYGPNSYTEIFLAGGVPASGDKLWRIKFVPWYTRQRSAEDETSRPNYDPFDEWTPSLQVVRADELRLVEGVAVFSVGGAICQLFSPTVLDSISPLTDE
jgi:hypothetical protein